jgi:hypothetical protein
MWALLIVAGDPAIQIHLQLLDQTIDFAPEGDAVSLVEQGSVEALDDAIGLQALGFCAAVVDVLRQVIGRRQGERCRSSGKRNPLEEMLVMQHQPSIVDDQISLKTSR